MCCVYNYSKVTIIITLEVACYSFLFVQTLKALNWNYSLKCSSRGLIKRTFLDLYSSKLRIFCLPKHRTKSPPTEGPHKNVGTWAPSYLATLMISRSILSETVKPRTSGPIADFNAVMFLQYH